MEKESIWSEWWQNLWKLTQVELFHFNGHPVSTQSLVLFMGGLIVALFFAHVFSRWVRYRFIQHLPVEQGMQYTIGRLLHYGLYSLAVVIVFQTAGVNLSGLTVVFGFLSVGVGFGLQNLTSNFVSGLILLLERPIQVGDRVTVNDLEGDVREIRIRSTVIETLNEKSIIVPNSDLVSQMVTNWSHGKNRIRILSDVGVSYGSDPQMVKKALLQAAVECEKVLSDPAPFVWHNGFGDSAWNMQLGYWVASAKDYYQVRSDVNFRIVELFREYGVEIPFPQRDLHIRSGLPDNMSGYQESVSAGITAEKS
jgi:small-conductance mechanosensitive channel